MNRSVFFKYSAKIWQSYLISDYLSKTAQESLKEFNGHYKELQLNFCIFHEKQKDKGIVKPTKTTLEVKF